MSRFAARIGRPILVVLALCIAPAAFAQVDSGLPNLPLPQQKKLPSADDFADAQMTAFDTNKNRKVTWEEFSARLRAAFNDMKSNRDYLTREDIKQAYIKAISAIPRPHETE